MAKLGAPGILSIIVALIGVFFFVAAVTGLLFDEPTPIGDVGMWSTVIVFLVLGLVGLWASIAENKQKA